MKFKINIDHKQSMKGTIRIKFEFLIVENSLETDAKCTGTNKLTPIDIMVSRIDTENNSFRLFLNSPDVKLFTRYVM